MSIMQMVFGAELGKHIKCVQAYAGDVQDLREQASGALDLRDMSAWTQLRRAQAWIAEREPPRCAWQGERVRRTVLQLGCGRPVGISLPFVHLYGARAGYPIALGDVLAPSILNPLLMHAHRF